MASSRDFRRVYHSLWGSQGFVLRRPSLAEKPSAKRAFSLFRTYGRSREERGPGEDL